MSFQKDIAIFVVVAVAFKQRISKEIVMKMHKALSLTLIATFTLVGCGGGDNTGSQAVQMNKLPIADAGQTQNMLIGDLVTLDGSKSSDADGDALTFKWTLTSKPTASLSVLSNSTSAMPTFTADVAGVYVASLTVFDKKDYSNPATVTITAAAANAAPVANAGVAQSVTTGMTVTLDGSKSSDANGDALTFKWTLTSKPNASLSVLTNSTSAMPTFTADVPGVYVASLVVNDGKVDSNPATVTITAAAANAAPVANAGVAQSVTTGMTVTLDGSKSSDANGDALTFKWTLTSRPNSSTATLSSTSMVKPTFLADVAGTYVATLIVNDGRLDSIVSNVTINAAQPSTQPKRIGTAYKARNGMTVTLVAFQISDLGNGYTRYVATIKQQNDTDVAIGEAPLRLFFTNGAYWKVNFFTPASVLPGESFALTRTYNMDVRNVDALIPFLLEYDGDWFLAEEPIDGALQWIFPIK